MRVNVYTHERTDGRGNRVNRPPLVLAYTRYQGEGACVHDVRGVTNGTEAKRMAIKDHRANCLKA
jgi:hypothetical protein